MSLDIDTIGYFLYMEEQEKESRYTKEDIDQEEEEKEGLYNG